jgi:hypothetical protein
MRRRRPSHALVSVLAVLGLLVAVGCSDDSERGTGPTESAVPTTVEMATDEATTTQTSRLPVSEDVAAALTEAAQSSGLIRWASPEVTVSLGGDATARDLEIVTEALGRLGALAGIRLMRVEGPADIDVVFHPRSEWQPAPEAPEPDGPFSGSPDGSERLKAGEAILRWSADGAIESVRVNVDSDTDQALRNSTIVHELLHALGLGHVDCKTSVVYGDTDGSPDWNLSSLDESLVRSWYSDALPMSTPGAEILALLVPTPGEPTCAPQRAQGVGTAEGALWCEVVFAPSRPCVFVDGSGEPPVPPFGSPARWIADGTVYDHDPVVYEVFVYDGRRVLCERQGDGRRLPCQITEGPGPLTGTDLWTDGETVFDTP